MGGFSVVLFILGFSFLFIALWLILSAYSFAIGIIGLVPAIISRKQRGSVIIITATATQMASGIVLFISFMLLFVRAFTASSQEQAIQTASSNDYSLISQALIIALIASCLLSLAGAVLSIIRTVKSRKGRIAPAKLTTATALTTVPSSLVFVVFSILVFIAVFSF